MAQTPQQRRAAQRELARNLSQGKTGISPNVSHRANLVTSIVQAKQELFGDKPKFNSKRSAEAVTVDPITGNRRSIRELEKMAKAFRQQTHTFYPVDDDDTVDDNDFDNDSWRFYQ